MEWAEDTAGDEKAGVLWVHYAPTDSYILLRDGADLAGGSDAGLDGACGRECNWTVPPTPLSGRQCIDAAD